MEEELRAILLGDAGVSNVAGNHVDWGANAQGATGPRVVLWVIDGSEGYTMRGPDKLWRGRVQADCYAESYGAVTSLSRAVVARLGGYRGGGFQGVFQEGTRSGREGGTNDAERPFRVSLDFMINWRREDG